MRRSPRIVYLVDVLAALIFAHRGLWLAVFAVTTLVLGYFATQLHIDAGFDKSIPLQHPYMKTYTEYQKTFGSANRILVALTRKSGDIYTREFLTTLKSATDEVFFIRGVDRSSVVSLFTPNARFVEIVEDGFAGGNIVPATFSGTPDELRQVRENVYKSGELGRLVANDQKGALISAQLLEVDPVSGQRLDYFAMAKQLEQVRVKFQSDDVDVHIIGFAKAIGDIADGARSVLLFFLIAFVITALLLLFYAGSVQLTVLALLVALLPVLWLLGLLPLLGYGIDPLSILVPFLTFSIGVSHAVQMTHAWKIESLKGASSPQAARSAFFQLFLPGALALLANAVGFLVITFIKIDIVRELGLIAGLGVAMMLLTNKILLPILLSYLRIRSDDARSTLPSPLTPLWQRIARLAERRLGASVLALALVLLMLGAWKAHELKTGDLDQGLPELKADSRYNRDSAEITKRFAIGVDMLGVIVQTHGAGEAPCMNYDVMATIDRFAARMRNVEGVHSVLALTDIAKTVNAAFNEGSLKWRELPRHPQTLGQTIGQVQTDSGLINSDCSAMQVFIFTEDHRGTTIARIVGEVKAFQAGLRDARIEFKLASGNVGVMAATNEAVDGAEHQMIGALFAAIGLMCLVAFRSAPAMLCIVLPLVLVSVLCNALMALLGIGLKVSTLPVIAFGVGVGVDYGIYLYGCLHNHLEDGATLSAALVAALRERGTAIVFTAVTMSLGVATWAYSALKLQADMGVLLAFMFLVNMLATLVLTPALAGWLLPQRQAAS